eukprot:3160_1
MMAFNFEEVQFIDQINKHIVFGYIRMAQNLFPSNIPYYNIPTLVLHACLLYYVTKEYFDQIGIKMKYNDNNKNTVELISGSVWNIAYGSKVIDANSRNRNSNAIYQWKIKLIKVDSDGCFCILGIDSSNIAHMYTQSREFWFSKAKYCIHGHSEESEPDESDKTLYSTNETWKEGDIITLNVDTMNRTIGYAINDSDVKTVFTKININAKYKFVVCVSGHHIIQINDFKVLYSKQ